MAAVTVNSILHFPWEDEHNGEESLKKEDTKPSLSQQMQELQKQQAILAEKIKEEEETARKQQFTIEKLEKLNAQQKERIKNYKSKHSKCRGKREMQQTNLMTAPRFEVILEILKKQEERIAYLEAKLEKKD